MPVKLIIKKGTRFGSLSVIKEIAAIHFDPRRTPPAPERRFLLKCRCGSKVESDLHSLRRGQTVKCHKCKGKQLADLNISRTIHGFTKKGGQHPLYRIWGAMKERCYNINHPRYKDWGGRGITICEQWRNDRIAFIEWALAHGWKKGLLLDRIDNNGNYEPNNCRFVTIKVSNNNKRKRWHTPKIIEVSNVIAY